jgi:hypothetical protein
MDVEAALRGVALAAASTVEHALSLAGALVIYYVRRMPRKHARRADRTG